jgi:hypothetical protein
MVELVEATFDDAFSCRERYRTEAFGEIGGDERLRSLGGNIPAEVVGIIGGVGDHLLGRQAGDQGVDLGDVIALAGGEQEAHRQAQTGHRQVDLLVRPPRGRPRA